MWRLSVKTLFSAKRLMFFCVSGLCHWSNKKHSQLLESPHFPKGQRWRTELVNTVLTALTMAKHTVAFRTKAHWNLHIYGFLTINKCLVIQYSKNTCVSASDSPYCCSVDEATAAVGEVRVSSSLYATHDISTEGLIPIWLLFHNWCFTLLLDKSLWKRRSYSLLR